MAVGSFNGFPNMFEDSSAMIIRLTGAVDITAGGSSAPGRIERFEAQPDSVKQTETISAVASSARQEFILSVESVIRRNVFVNQRNRAASGCFEQLKNCGDS